MRPDRRAGRCVAAWLGSLLLLGTTAGSGQDEPPPPEPPAAPTPASPVPPEPLVLVAIYRIPWGRQQEFVDWIVAREAEDSTRSLPLVEWYAHSIGMWWDYVAVVSVDAAQRAQPPTQLAAAYRLVPGDALRLNYSFFVAYSRDIFAMGETSVPQIIRQAETRGWGPGKPPPN